MAILVPLPEALPGLMRDDLARAEELARKEKAPNTHRAYEVSFKTFEAWCTARGVSALPAEPTVVAAFVSSEAERGLKPSTMNVHVAAIRHFHKLSGLPPPTDDERVRAVVRGHRRHVGVRPAKKAAATADRVIAMAMVPGGRVKDLRDRALLLLGFAGAFRRSELVALNVEDIAHSVEDGVAALRITVRKSKTDQEGQGATILIKRGQVACPVAALKAWLEAAQVMTGAVFRQVRKGDKVGERLSDHSASAIVKRHAERVGLDPARFSGHSLRAGFLTSAVKARKRLDKMMEVSRHKSVVVLQGYVRDAELAKDHAGDGLL